MLLIGPNSVLGSGVSAVLVGILLPLKAQVHRVKIPLGTTALLLLALAGMSSVPFLR